MIASNFIDCEQSLFCSKIRRENERDGMRDIPAASGEALSWSLFCSKIRRENERDGMRDMRAVSGEAVSRE